MFVHYFSQIVTSIPAVALSPYFVQQNIISPSEQLEIFNATLPNKAASLLLSNISSALKAGITKEFYKFLDITEQHGNIDSINVTNAIRKKLFKLKSKNEGIVCVPKYVASYLILYCTYVAMHTYMYCSYMCNLVIIIAKAYRKLIV